MTGEIVSIQVGRVQHHVTPESQRVDFRHANWTSGIYKYPVTGPVHMGKLLIDGDGQHDLVNHGGPDSVALAYDADHYPVWRQEFGIPDLAYGSFGENFTVRGFSDDTVCIGDVWQIGKDVRVEVSQSRQPCYKLARRLNQPHIIKRVHETSWGGWYLRVLQEGTVQAGMQIELIERKHPQWTIATAVQAVYARKKNVARAHALAALPELSQRWKDELNSVEA